MLTFGQLSQVSGSGSGRSSPKTFEKEESYYPLVTVEMAVLQIQGILQFCIDENKVLLNSTIMYLMLEKQDFNEKFSSLLEFNKDGMFTVGTIKNYVLKTLLPNISKLDGDAFVGKTQLCSKLLHAVKSWRIPQKKTVSSNIISCSLQLECGQLNEGLNANPGLLMIYDGSLKHRKTEVEPTQLSNNNLIWKKPKK